MDFRSASSIGLVAAVLVLGGCSTSSNGAGDDDDDGSTSNTGGMGSGGGTSIGGSGGTADPCGSCTGTCVDGACYQQHTIDFDDLQFGDEVTTQYAALATFSTDGPGLHVADYNWDSLSPKVSSEPNILCPGNICAGCCRENTYIDFSAPVRAVRFVGVGVNSSGPVARAVVYGTAGLLGTIDIIGHGDNAVPPITDLSVYEDVVRLEIVDVTDEAGLLWDDFSFEVQE
jgi:hypothetical protein